MNLHISVLPCGRKMATGSVQLVMLRVGHGLVNATAVECAVEALIQSHHGPCIIELATIVRGAEQGDLGTLCRNPKALCGQPAEHATRFLLPKNSYLALEQELQALPFRCGHRVRRQFCQLCPSSTTWWARQTRSRLYRFRKAATTSVLQAP